jgi:hypothetical protein
MSGKDAQFVAATIMPGDEAGPGDASKLLTMLREYLHDGSEQRGIIPDEAIEAPKGVSESTTDPQFMRRVCMAMCDLNHIVPDKLAAKGERPANVYERLTRAGCPVEMYLDMVQNPEYMRLLFRTTVELIIFSQIPQIQAALAVKAAHGDDKATRLLFEVTRLLEVQTQDDIRMQYARMDEAAMLRLMEAEANKTLEYIRQHRGDDLLPAPPPATPQTVQISTTPKVDLDHADFAKPED